MIYGSKKSEKGGEKGEEEYYWEVFVCPGIYFPRDKIAPGKLDSAVNDRHPS